MRDIINITMGELTTAVDNEVMKVVQKIGIDVDKEELLKALELYHNLVRCKECKWCDDAGKKRALICTNPYIDVDPHPNFFCGYGEREGE